MHLIPHILHLSPSFAFIFRFWREKIKKIPPVTFHFFVHFLKTSFFLSTESVFSCCFFFWLLSRHRLSDVYIVLVTFFPVMDTRIRPACTHRNLSRGTRLHIPDGSLQGRNPRILPGITTSPLRQAVPDNAVRTRKHST